MTVKTGIVLAVIGVILLIVAAYAVTYYSANVRGAVSANEQIKADGNFRIAAYDKFFDDCATIQSTEGRIVAQKSELNQAPSAFRREQILANLTALKSLRVEQITRYNTDASKNYTIGQFRASKLPYYINPSPESETVCSL